MLSLQLLLWLLIFRNCAGLLDFREALQGFGINEQPRRPPAFRLESELPRTSWFSCKEFPNEGASSISALAAIGPVRSCHMQGVCLSIRESKNTVHVSKYLRTGSQIPQVQRGEFYFGSYSGMRATNAATFTLEAYDDDSLARRNFSIAVIEDPSIVSRRYMGSNTMHVFHDDFLPALSTILQQPLLKTCPAEQRLILAVDDFPLDNDSAQFLKWLGNFWTIDYLQAAIRYLSGMSPEAHLDFICFDDVVMGAEPVSTSWYHYGYYSPQGPIELSEATWKLVSSNIKATAQWLKQELLIEGGTDRVEDGGEDALQAAKPLNVSIVSRTRSRLILNEHALAEAIKAAYPGSAVYFLRAEESQLDELIELVAQTDVLIGIHGALLALTAFLPRGSLLIEMFPFAVPAENYTPFKTLAGLIGADYATWVNPRSEPPFNIGHPEAHYTAGGLDHLPASYAAGIIATETVPKHLCCYSPFWIYRIFQDTRVDIDAILELMNQRGRKLVAGR